MDYAKTLLFICPMVFLAGFIDSIAGGGGLISMPAFLAAGIPPHNVLGCNKFQSVFGTGMALSRFVKSGNIHIKSAVFSVAAALVGSACGAWLALILDAGVLRIIMLLLLPAALLFILLKRDFGDMKEPLPPRRLLAVSAIISLFIGMYDGFFGPGTGTFLILAFTSILGFDILTASGNAKAVNFASNIAALAVFASNGKVLLPIAVPAALFSLAGGFLGSGLAIKKGMKIIKPAFIIVILLLMVKIIYDIRQT